MFGLKKEKGGSSNNNSKYETLVAELNRLAGGDFAYVNREECTDDEIADAVDSVIRSFKHANNNFVMRANHAMESIGDNSYVKCMLDQVLSQSESIRNMQTSSSDLEESIDDINVSVEHIRDNTHIVLKTTEESVANMKINANAIDESSKEINRINTQIQDFQEKINAISEIVDVVKKVASQSNLLALNASIEAARAGEAGKGFAVVADQVRELSSNTSNSADDIVKYVGELQSSIAELALAMEATTRKLEDGNKKIEDSIKSINGVNHEINDVSDSIDSIYHAVEQQSVVTKNFAASIKSLTDSYDILADDCHKTGEHIYKIGRYVDTLRSDMYRGVAEVTLQDQLRIFEIDHFILTWRVYNNAVGFESLRLEQLNNATGPKACKIGKWLQSQTDKERTDSQEFKNLVTAHGKIHEMATKSWEAKDAGDVELALSYFDKTYEAFLVYRDAIGALKDFERRRGNSEETEIVVFGK